MTLRERCHDTNTEIIVVKEGGRQSGQVQRMREQDRGRKRKRRKEVIPESWSKG